PRAKRIRRPETTSTAFQRRKRCEVISLREEVRALGRELNNLKLKNQKIWESVCQSQTMAFTWCEEVLKQHCRRVVSENLNRKLKEIVARQTEVGNTICSVFQQQDPFYVSIILPLSTKLLILCGVSVGDGCRHI
ncbi:hypothetical protein PHMEG_00029416, partial [Phytophthora megakarya]